MIIVIDARESGTSTGRYIDKLVEYLHKLRSDLEIVILTKSHRLSFFKDIAPNFKVIESNYKEFTFAEQLAFARQLRHLKPDLVHFGMTQQPISFRGRSITTIHDLTTVRFNNPAKNKAVFRTKQQVYRSVVKRVARKSLYVITPSEFVKKDLAEFAGICPDKIIVTYEAAEKIIAKPEPMLKLIDKKFIMYVGRPLPHKNLQRLIEAFVKLQARHPELSLVLAGKKDVLYERFEQYVKKHQIKNVLFTDFISDGQLRWLYENCAAYVFPSLSEGFGLPGLEAMQAGAPVVSSDATCLPEIYGEAAHYFDPKNVNDMTSKINDVLENPELRGKLVETGAKQAAKYSWEQMAQQTLDVYNKALDINT